MAIDGISFTNRARYFGLASGLDVDEIVRGLMQAERAPLDRLLQKRQILEWQQEDLRTINRMLRELDDLAFNLRLESAFAARHVSVSDAGAVSAAVTAGASLGTHTIRVHQLAQGLRLHSTVEVKDGTTLADLGFTNGISFRITRVGPGGDEESETITLDSNHTLRDVANVINSSASRLGIKAVYEPDLGRLFITSTATGSDVQFRFDDESGGSLNGFFSALGLSDRDGSPVQAGAVYAGQNAVFEYDGVLIERATNQFTAGGVTYTLHRADPAAEIVVAVGQDTDAVVERIKAFVTKYNEIVAHVNTKLLERRYYDYPPLTEAQRKEMEEEDIRLWQERARSGLLRGDAMLSSILSSLRQALGAVVSGTGSEYNSLASVGITTGPWSERGILHLDEAKLREAREQDPAGVAALFRQDGAGGERGLIHRVRDALKSGMERITDRVGTAGSSADLSAIGRQIGWLNDAIARTEERLARREEYYYRQFAALEAFISQANTQSMWLAQAFGAWWA